MTPDFDSSTAESAPTQNISSLGRRLGAFCIDSVILGLMLAVATHIIPIIGTALVWFFYGPVLESSEIRATLGKYLMGIQVVDLMGRRISLRSSLIRNALKIVSTALLFIGFFIAVFSRKRQTLHDLLADTLVVYGRSETQVVDAWVAESKEIFRTGNAAVNDLEPSLKPDDSVVAQLERLQKLLNEGAITQIEYDAAKRKILGG